MNIQKIPLGTQGPEVPRIGLGCMGMTPIAGEFARPGRVIIARGCRGTKPAHIAAKAVEMKKCGSRIRWRKSRKQSSNTTWL